MNESRFVGWWQIVKCFERENFKSVFLFDKKPEELKLSQYGCDMMSGRNPCHNTCSSVLEKVSFLERFDGRTKNKSVVVVSTGGRDKDSSNVRDKRRTETIIIRVTRYVDEDDTQTLNSQIWKDSYIFNRDGWETITFFKEGGLCLPGELLFLIC